MPALGGALGLGLHGTGGPQYRLGHDLDGQGLGDAPHDAGARQGVDEGAHQGGGGARQTDEGGEVLLLQDDGAPDGLHEGAYRLQVVSAGVAPLGQRRHRLAHGRRHVRHGSHHPGACRQQRLQALERQTGRDGDHQGLAAADGLGQAG